MTEANPLPKPGNAADPGAVVTALEGLFSTHEARVLGAISLFVGYLCILLTKIMAFEAMYMGLVGIAGLIVLLLLLNKDFQLRTLDSWFRIAAVVVIGLILTSP